jgi:hypothetical protein
MKGVADMSSKESTLKMVLVIVGLVLLIGGIIAGISVLTSFDWSTWNLAKLVRDLLIPLGAGGIGAIVIAIGMNYK